MDFYILRNYDDYAFFAQAGKKINKVASRDLLNSIIDTGVPIASLEPVYFKEAWLIKKYQCRDLKKDGSNFFEIAEKVK